MKTVKRPNISLALQRLSELAGAVTCGIGCVVLIGWFFNIAILKSVLPGLVTMKANTAIAFILGGAALWLLHQRLASRAAQRLVTGLAVAVLLIGLLTLLQYGWNWDLGIDQLFFQEEVTAVATSHPNRMAANTALDFLLLGSALFLLTRPHPNYLAAHLLTLVAFLIALLGLLGYTYGVTAFYGFGSYTKMAVHTAIAFLLLSGGVIFFNPNWGLVSIIVQDDAGGMMARQLFLAVLLVPPVLGWLILAGYRAKFYNEEVGLSLFGVLSIVVFAILVWWNARSLSQMDDRRRRAEAQSQADALAAAQAGAHLTAVINNLQDALLVTDPNHHISRFNPAFLQILDLEGENLEGQDCQILEHPQITELIKQTSGSVREALKVEIELPGQRMGQAIATPILQESTLTQSAQWLGSAILIRDVTAEWEINQMKTDFISTVSHELRTPLTSVLGFTSIIKERLQEDIFPVVTSDDPRVQKALRKIETNLNIIESEAERLTSLINDVLDIAKMEAGRVEWDMQWINPSELVDWACVSTSAFFENSTLELHKQIQPDLPLILGDRDRLLQVLINLISNAVKFTVAGSVTCTVSLQEKAVHFSVTDTGMGIAPRDQARIFEKFRQVGDTLTNKPKGTGLGLPICKQIVEHHGGRIWVESVLDQGSTFSFLLPVPAETNFLHTKPSGCATNSLSAFGLDQKITG